MFMIKSFQHRGLEAFFRTGSKAGIQPHHADKLQTMLTALNLATAPQDMNAPAWRLHPLKGHNLKGHWSVWVNGNWRMTFRFQGIDVVLVDYQDYH
jgi:proteic killer suppression protein